MKIMRFYIIQITWNQMRLKCIPYIWSETIRKKSSIICIWLIDWLQQQQQQQKTTLNAFHLVSLTLSTNNNKKSRNDLKFECQTYDFCVYCYLVIIIGRFFFLCHFVYHILDSIHHLISSDESDVISQNGKMFHFIIHWYESANIIRQSIYTCTHEICNLDYVFDVFRTCIKFNWLYIVFIQLTESLLIKR